MKCVLNVMFMVEKISKLDFNPNQEGGNFTTPVGFPLIPQKR